MNTSVVTAEYGAKASGHNTRPFGCIRLTVLWHVSTLQMNQQGATHDQRRF